MRMRRWFWVTIGILIASWALSAEPMVGIPFKPDPPFALDGELDDWRGVPGMMLLERREQVTWGASRWESGADLSAKGWLAWRQDMLYLAADVADDQLRQTQRASNMWRGDHLELYIDAAPEDDPGRTTFGKGQFQIVLSPGNFRKTGDVVNDCPPEIYCHRPNGAELKGAIVAATRGKCGWTIEAGIPWSALGVARPTNGMPLHFELGVSDTDGTESRQETLLTFSTKPWAAARRTRLNAGVLAGADGKAVTVPRGVGIFERAELKPRDKQTHAFTAPGTPPGKEAVIALRARLDTPKVGGYTQALRLTLNGTALDGKRLVNKPLEGKSEDGRLHRFAAAEHFSTYYAPDFTSADTSRYGVRGVKTGEFELRVTDILADGENRLVIENACRDNVTRTLVAADCQLRFQTPPPPPKPKRGPPIGEIPICAPIPEPKTRYAMRELPDARLVVGINGEEFSIRSRFSVPSGEWECGSNAFFQHQRRIEQKAEAIVVTDTFKNLTHENLPLMQRHEVGISAQMPMRKIWLGGTSPAGLTGTSSEGANPTTFGVTDGAGLGFLPLNDEFQVHVTNYAADGALGLADNEFVLRPGATYTAEWAIVPVARPDYFDFINAARRFVDANFTIPYCFAFLRAGKLTEKWSDTQFADFIRLKGANLVCAGLSSLRYQGHYPQGIAFQLVPHDSYKRYVERVRRLAPGVKTSVYFHCYIDAEDEAAAKFPDARVLRSDGGHADYGQPFYGIFFPTEDNAYGRAIRRNVDIILNEIGADGVYWDELEYSAYAYHYGEPWDGCSADIDPATLKIRRLKSSVTLLTQSWRVRLIQEIMARGPFIANGQPRTRTVARLKFPRFVETGSIGNCARAQLHSPIALGDHLTERSEEDAYRNMVTALDYGCVSHWYSDMQVVPGYETIAKYMYPITPMELHEGYIIGKERIVTNRSGLFGWCDASTHEVHVFDDTGREVSDFKAPRIERGGQAFTELRIGEGWSAAIVRK